MRTMLYESELVGKNGIGRVGPGSPRRRTGPGPRAGTRGSDAAVGALRDPRLAYQQDSCSTQRPKIQDSAGLGDDIERSGDDHEISGRRRADGTAKCILDAGYGLDGGVR